MIYEVSFLVNGKEYHTSFKSTAPKNSEEIIMKNLAHDAVKNQVKFLKLSEERVSIANIVISTQNERLYAWDSFRD